MVMVLFIRLTMRLGTSCKKPLPAPQRPEQDSNTRRGDPSKQEPREERESNSQLIKTSWKGTKREQHLNCLTEKKREKRKIFILVFRALYIGKLNVGFQQRPPPRTDTPDKPTPPPRPTHPNRLPRPALKAAPTPAIPIEGPEASPV